MQKREAGPRFDEATGTWWFVVDVGLPGGPRKQAKRRGFPSQKRALEELTRLRTQVIQQTYVPPTRQHLGEFLVEDWLPAIKHSVKPSTFASYQAKLRLHVIPYIGTVQMQAVDAAMLNRLYGELLSSGNKRGEKDALSARTVRYVHTIVHRALKDAVRWSRIVRNPADVATPPRAKDARPPEMKTWSAKTLSDFLSASEQTGERLHFLWLFLATTGTRRGEAVGVRWSDIDLDKGRAAIRQTITVIDNVVHVAPTTKTDRSRQIELDRRTVEALRTLKVQQAREKLLMGPGYSDNDLVFCEADGSMYNPEHVSRKFERRTRIYGVPTIRLHDLRHTWATLALQAGIPAKVVSERLGHTSIVVTLDMYSHATPAMTSDAAEAVASLIFGA